MQPCSSCDDTPETTWSSLRPRATKLINSVSASTIRETAQRFVDLGFPWADSDCSSSLANLIVSASAGHGFYADCYAQLIHTLNSRCVATEAEADTAFLSAVKASVCEKFRCILSGLAASEDEVREKKKVDNLNSRNMEGRLRDKLVNTCKLVANLFQLRVYMVNDIHCTLKCLGVLSTLNFKVHGGNDDDHDTVGAVELPDLSSGQHAMPQVAFLSGTRPSTQPIYGERMVDWKERLTLELNFPPDRLLLLSDGQEVAHDATLQDFEGVLQLLVRPVIKGRISSGCCLRTSQEGNARPARIQGRPRVVENGVDSLG